MSVAVLRADAAAHCPAIARTPPRELIVTPAPAVHVVVPAPHCSAAKIVPTGNAIVEFGGIVNVFAVATFIVTVLNGTAPSANTNVYDAVCEFDVDNANANTVALSVDSPDVFVAMFAVCVASTA